ncbi:hypothetical protein DL89DRAFT_270737 [Linderina pennispora]|uniref:Uncharacterized protein n=1 Tax=Linderina pennispora TaxID=61395 RepID=A0A1Y1VXZ5_9FUNG|nr:uncharacterized protein DL89DRAFT_270737 [Linderina pennispora]ORX65684.1 hypothetical protein DL89DRAFT_270737 [Linderina pennispora]
MYPLAQSPPMLILERIVFFYVGNLMYFEPGPNACFCAPYTRLAAILGVCRSWREAGLDKLYEELWWCNVHSCTFCNMRSCCGRTLTHKLHGSISAGNILRVRKLRLHWDVATIADGLLNGVFQTAPFSHTFPKATSVEWSFWCGGERVDASTPVESALANAFCSHISRIFPDTNSITICESPLFADHSDTPFARSLVSGLLDQATSIECHASLPAGIDPISICMMNMRSLSFTIRSADSLAIEVIHRNASSLEVLQVHSSVALVFSKLVLVDGIPKVYPSVQSLSLDFSNPRESDINIPLDSPAGAPFPALKQVELYSLYPFGNDVVFRGCRLTLEIIDTSLDEQSTQVLVNHGVFDPDRFPLLSDLAIFYFESIFQEPKKEILSPLICLGAKLRVLNIYTSCYSFDSLELPIGIFGQNITVLKIPFISFSLHQALQLIQTLPYLRWMAIDIDSTDEMLTDDGTHSGCMRHCRHRWLEDYQLGDSNGSTADGDSDREDISGQHHNQQGDLYHRDYSGNSSQNGELHDFLFDHLDVVYANMQFLDKLYADFYPLSTTLTILENPHCDEQKVAICRAIIILMVLCPSIRMAYTTFAEDETIARSKVVETEHHSSLVHNLESAIYTGN